MERIKLIALDMDGTLLDDKGEVSPANREAISLARERGVEVVLSTGRYIRGVREYAESLHLSSYLVTTNGSEVWSTSGELLERHVIPLEMVQWMREMANEYGTWYWASSVESMFRPETFPQDVFRYEWLKFGFDTADDGVRSTIWEKLSATGQLEVTNSNLTNIEVNAKGVSKAAGLKSVCRRLNLTMDNVLAIGDSLNDIAMIRAVGCGVAMDNAQQQVKDAADWVTATNLEDGVAKAIHHWVLDRSN